MKLYHISSNLDFNGVFVPRIPCSTLSGEDQTQSRVCTSKTIKGCFSAMPEGPELLSNDYFGHGGYFKLFEIDTEKLGLSKIIDSEQLSKQGLVSDAIINEEVWIQESFQVCEKDTHIIWVRDWEEEIIEDIFDTFTRMNRNKEVKVISDLKYDSPFKHFGDEVQIPLLKDEDVNGQIMGQPFKNELSFKQTITISLPGGEVYHANVFRVVTTQVDLTDYFLSRGHLFRKTYDFGGISIHNLS